MPARAIGGTRWRQNIYKDRRTKNNTSVGTIDAEELLQGTTILTYNQEESTKTETKEKSKQARNSHYKYTNTNMGPEKQNKYSINTHTEEMIMEKETMNN